MQLTYEELYERADFLVIASSGLSLFIQVYKDSEYTLEYDDGTFFGDYNKNVLVEVLNNGNVLIDDLEMTAYTTQIVNLKDNIL